LTKGREGSRGRKKDPLFERLGEDGHVEEGGDVDSELKEDREKNVKVENVAQRSLSRQLVDRL
jgi:hypothetical protein